MKSNQDDYLKYWRVIRQWAKVHYEVSQADLDLLFFLYSEKYFTRDKFEEFSSLIGWDRDRFFSLKRRGWIEIFRDKMNHAKPIYQLSIKATRMIRNLYNKLSGEEIPTSLSNNKMFRKNVSYTDKVYRNMITEMNKTIKQQRRQPPE